MSPFIGAKVFLNLFSAIFGYAPTKVRLFKGHIDPDSRLVYIEEISTKGSSSKRLVDYGITNESKLFII